MLLRAAVLAVLLALPGAFASGPAAAETASGAQGEVSAPVAELLAAMKMRETLEIMRLEGLAYGETLEKDLLGGTGGEAWNRTIDKIYDIDGLADAFSTALSEEFAQNPEMVAPALAFFASEQGQRITTLEVEARRALLDEAVEEAAKVAAEKLEAEQAPLFDELRRFIAAGDLEERNVAGALTSSLAFYEGMARESRQQGRGMNPDDIKALVWGQEPEIRAETDAWLMSYLSLAYSPLPPGELAAYTAFWESPEGQSLNAALFAAFDQVFPQISRELGRAAALQLGGDDI